jgi:hypothetical protein
MPPVSIPVTQCLDSGVTPPAQTNGDLVNGNQLDFNDGRIIVECISTDAGAQSVVIVTPGTVGGFAIADNTVAVPAGATRIIGPFAPSTYNQSDGSVRINPSIATTLKFRAYRV